MEEKEMDEVEFFKVRPLGTEEKGFIITAGNTMASKKKFETQEEAEEYIKSKPYDLIFTLAVAVAKAVIIENKEGGNK
jgi:hypothetical protein